MHVAAKAGHTDCMKYLIHYKSRLDIQDASSMTPLHYAGESVKILNLRECGWQRTRIKTNN